MQSTKPSLPSIKFLLEPQQNIPHLSNGSSGLAVATIAPTKALIDATKTDIAQYHFPSTQQRKDLRQLPLPPSSLPSIQTDIHGLAPTPPNHGLHSHGHARSYSDSTPYRQPLDFESSHAPHPYSNHYATSPSAASPSYLSPHQNQYPYGNNAPHYHQYPGPRQNLSPPLPTPPHVGARPRPPHNHSRSMSDYTHPYASSLPNDSTYLTPVHHEPLREKPHRFTPSHRRAGSASTIDYMLNNTHISPAPTQAPRPPEPSRYTPPIPTAPSNSSNGTTSQDDDQEVDESSSIDGGTHSDRSESPLPSGKDAAGADQNRYVCPYCNKRFSRPSSLRIHTYSHTGEKPFVCTEEGCGRKFSVQSNMRRHLRVHRMGRTVKKVRYDGEVDGVRGNSCDNATGHARGNSGSSLDSTGGRDRDDGGLHRSGTI